MKTEKIFEIECFAAVEFFYLRICFHVCFCVTCARLCRITHSIRFENWVELLPSALWWTNKKKTSIRDFLLSVKTKYSFFYSIFFFLWIRTSWIQRIVLRWRWLFFFFFVPNSKFKLWTFEWNSKQFIFDLAKLFNFRFDAHNHNRTIALILILRLKIAKFSYQYILSQPIFSSQYLFEYFLIRIFISKFITIDQSSIEFKLLSILNLMPSEQNNFVYKTCKRHFQTFRRTEIHGHCQSISRWHSMLVLPFWSDSFEDIHFSSSSNTCIDGHELLFSENGIC